MSIFLNMFSWDSICPIGRTFLAIYLPNNPSAQCVHWAVPLQGEPGNAICCLRATRSRYARGAYHTAKRYIAWEAHITPKGYIANPAVSIPIMPEIATPVCALVRNDNGDGIYIAANKKLPSEEGSFIVSN